MATRSLMVTAAVTLLLVVAVALTSPASVRAASDSSDDSTSNVVVLTDETFEHDTQISSGATTGDWFIKFYAPWCGFCKAIAPVWDELADKVKESNVNIAKVDCTKNRLTCERFGVRGYPSLFFFHNGQIYKYNGARDLTSLTAYALGGWEDDSGESAPSAPSFFQEKLLQLDEILSEIHLHDDPTTNAILLGLMLAGIIAGVLIVVFITILCLCCPPESEAAVRVQQAKQEQAMQQKHKQDKKKGESGGNKDDDEQEDEDAGDKAAVSGGDARKGGARRRRAEQ